MKREMLLRKVTVAVANDPSATLADIAGRVGIGRTTLHRSFATREVLLAEVARFAIADIDRIFAQVELDDQPAADVLNAMGDVVMDLATAYSLLFTEPPITKLAGLDAAAEVRIDRFERFAERAQIEGVFRPDVPARWIVYSVVSQALALFIAVRDGFVGERMTKRLFLSTVSEGLSASAQLATMRQ